LTYPSALGDESSLNKFSEKKSSLAIAVLLLLVAIATLQSVAAPNQLQQVSSTTTTETTTETNTVALRYLTRANSSQIQALSDYGVVRLQTTVGGMGSTINVALNSTVGPIYLEQLQLSLSSTQTYDVVAASVTIGGLNGPTCSGTIIPKGQLYGDFLPTCPSTAKITDPAGNLAIAASAGTSNMLSMQPVANEASEVTGQVVIIALICAPITADVTLTANLQ
jgi:hypothetical protein